MKGEAADVLVVGGGPAGATAACQLAKAGVGVTLVDRATFPRDKTCGESLSPGALTRLSAIGMWPPPPVPGEESVAMPVRGMRLCSPDGTTFSGRYREGPMVLPGLAMRRSVFDLHLLSLARASGVRILEGIEAISVVEASAGEASVSARATGSTSTLRLTARRVVVADGRQSFLARQLGFLERESQTPPTARYAVRAHCADVSGLTDFAEMHVGSRGYCGVAPLAKASANVCYVIFDGAIGMGPKTREADFRRHIEDYPGIAARLRRSEVQGAIRVAGPLRLISKRHWTGPFIACGDTTGFLDPFTGEGIAHAIASGVFGAEAVRASLSGDSRSFARYEQRVRGLRRVKGTAALVLHGLVSRPRLANSAARFLARTPRFANALIQLFGDQV